ncbi:MAG: DUF4388 domain-containing protein [Calothrix sp. MO_167.B12]|nr:DUF4388 domain-containing protein [Calothrix sp. MO_167.B12]
MAVTGRLAEFSLPELFQLLEQGNKTGLLTLRTTPTEFSEKIHNHYIWFQEGRIVAAANRLDGHGLLIMVKQCHWIGDDDYYERFSINVLDKPLGMVLKTEGTIPLEYQKKMFYVQVMQQVCSLFEFQDGHFYFEPGVKPPFMEMTGLSAPATEVTLAGLRALKKWDALSDKLPDITSGLVSMIEGKPNMHLNQEEWQLWEFVDGNTSLKIMSQQLNLSKEKIQQIAFRLIAVNLCEEIPFVEMKFTDKVGETSASGSELEAGNVQNDFSESFLQNLMGFLKSKI